LAIWHVYRKVAVVTGGGTGIGYQVARAYAEAGADVALFYNTSAVAIEKAKDLEKEFSIKAKAYKVPGVPLSSPHVLRPCAHVTSYRAVSDAKIVTESIEQVEKDFGRLDIFVRVLEIFQLVVQSIDITIRH